MIDFNEAVARRVAEFEALSAPQALRTAADLIELATRTDELQQAQVLIGVAHALAERATSETAELLEQLRKEEP